MPQNRASLYSKYERGVDYEGAVRNLFEGFESARKRRREDSESEREAKEKQEKKEAEDVEFAADRGVPRPVFELGAETYARNILGKMPIGPKSKEGEFVQGEKAAQSEFEAYKQRLINKSKKSDGAGLKAADYARGIKRYEDKGVELLDDAELDDYNQLLVKYADSLKLEGQPAPQVKKAEPEPEEPGFFEKFKTKASSLFSGKKANSDDSGKKQSPEDIARKRRALGFK